jgi:mycothiol synthase
MRLRAPESKDLAAVLAVLVARDVADLGEPDSTLEDLNEQWSASEFDRETDALVVELEDGRIAAYAAVRRNGTLVAVDPEFERRGIGSRVLEWVEQRERELSRSHHRQWGGASSEPSKQLLTSAGYAHVRSYFRMVYALHDLDDLPEALPAVTVRRPDLARDGIALHELDAASFAAVPDYQPSTFNAFRDEHLNLHDADLSLSNLAVEGDAIVGFLLTRRWPDQGAGFIDLLAVHPDQQRRGLGTTLLATAFREYAAAGLREAQLGVASDNPAAVRLYERLGMTPRFQIDTYERAVEA